MIDFARSLEEQRNDQRRETDHGPMAKTLVDLVRYREIIRACRPTAVLETGTWTGASAHWFGWQMTKENTTAGSDSVPLVVTIDLRRPAELVQSPLYAIVDIEGDSTDPAIADHATRLLAGQPRVMVVLDADHSTASVAAEIELYAPLVTPGQYLVVEDTLTAWMPNQAGYAGSPAYAVDAWLAAGGRGACDFANDDELEDLLPTTQHPGGWLRRAS